MGTFIKNHIQFTLLCSASLDIVFSTSLSDSAPAKAKQLQHHKGLWLATQQLVGDLLPLRSSGMRLGQLEKQLSPKAENTTFLRRP